MAPAPDLVLVDGSSYVYRAFHALPPLSNSRGEPTGAVLGVLNMLVKFMKDYQPRRIGVVFDAPGKTFRDELFAEYKAQRPTMPDDLRAQIKPLYDIIKAQGLPLLCVPGVEADDVIGTLARRAAQAGEHVLISTGDKDMAQLVDGSITLINTMNNTVLDREGVKLKFDVYPEQIIDYLALVGDSSDNIPGIDKVGPKTGAKLLNQYGEVGNLLAHVAEVPGKVGENLRAGLETLELSRRLATIRVDVELPPEAWNLTPGPPDRPRLRELYTRYELRGLLRQLEPESAAPAAGAATGAETSAATGPAAAGVATDAVQAREYETVTRWEDFERWLKALSQAELFAFDTETTSLDYMQAEIVGLSFCIEPGSAAYVPLRHVYPGAPEQLDRARVLERLKPILEDSRRGKVGHNLKYDAHVLLNDGIALDGMRFDTMLESYVLNSVATNHDMDSDARRYLGITTTTYEEVTGKGAKQICFDQVPLDKASEYAAEDADVTLRLHRALWPQLEALPALARLYQECEQPLVPVLLAMEHYGVLVDREQLRAQSREFARQLQELVLQAHREAGHEFNIESPQQLQQILFERLALPVRRKTPTGQPSTAEDVLEELATSYALPRIVLDYRGARQAQVHLHRQAAGAGRRAHRAHPHQLCTGGGRDRAVVLGRSQSAEHPDAPRRGAAHPPGLHRPRGARAAGGGLLADRAAHHGAPVRGCDPHGGIRRRSRRAPGDRRGSIQRRARGGDVRPAPHGQGDQLRPHLRHVALRPRAQPRHRARRRAAVRRPLLPALPGREAVHG